MTRLLRKTIYVITCCGLSISYLQAQDVHIDSANTLNMARLQTNKHGMDVLGSWGLVNIAAGTIGYFTTSNKEWKDFHLMNLSWGLVNTAIAGMGLGGVKQEMAAKINCNDMLQRYESNKRLYLINAGLDAVYIGTGVFLWEHSNSVSSHAELWSGFGKSVALQGLFLLFFDSTMYASHASKNKKWYGLMQGLYVTNNGIGFHYALR